MHRAETKMKFDFTKDISALKAGDKGAFNRLMEDYYGWSVKEARKIVHDSERAKDVAVAFWEQLPQQLQKNAPEDGALLAWMEQCVRNLALNVAERRKQPKVRYEAEPDDIRADEPDPTLRLSALQDLDAIANKLRSARHKDVFWRLIEGATPQDIAQECDIAESRARALIAEVRAVILERINQ